MTRILLSLMLLVASLASFAYDFEIDGIYYNVLSRKDLTCEVTVGGNKYTGKVIIPEQVRYSGKVFRVIKIGNNAFYRCPILFSITIPNSVNIIGNYAFEDCRGLTVITIPSSVKKIGDSVFSGCGALKEIQCLAKTPPSCGPMTFAGVNKIGCVIKVPKESISTYSAHEYWNTCWDIVAISTQD